MQQAHRVPDARPAQVAGGALRTFFNITREWGLKDSEARELLGCPANTYFRWKRNPGSARLGGDTLERISYIFGIYKDLQILYPLKSAATSWIMRANRAPQFGGHTPLERMRGGRVADLYETRQYLDARRGGWA